MNRRIALGPVLRRARPRLSRRLRKLAHALLLPALLGGLSSARPAHAYSLLTHEELIDLTWQSSIVPLLLSRYPSLTPAELEHARAYAYGGCVIQDIGYYPLGDAFYSDLTHYVRSGDLVVNLFRDAGNADELAFAVGALSHYIGDTIGHAEATNLSVPVEFPRLADRYGSVVTYAEGEHAHVQTEFAFDVNDIAQHRLAPVRYLRHVGLQVPLKQLGLAFYQTYGIPEDLSVGRRRHINVGAYRFAVHRLIPRVAYALTLLHRRHEPLEVDSPELRQLQTEIAQVEQENNWAQYRRAAGPGTYLLAGFIEILPKVGPLKLVAIKGPDAQTEAAYIHSLVASVNELNRDLRRFTPPPTTRPHAAAESAAADTASEPPPSQLLPVTPGSAQAVPRQSNDPNHPLPNRDLDTGNPVRPSGYRLTDQTYATLTARLTAHPGQPIPSGVKADILAYYGNLDLPFATKKQPQAWAALQRNLATLRAMPTSAEPAAFQTYDDDAETPASAASQTKAQPTQQP